MNANQRLAAWVIGAVVLAAAAFVAGRETHPAPAAGYAFEQETPAYTAGLPAVGRSLGGFSGFDTPESDPVMLSGRVIAVSEDAIEIESAGGARTTIEITSDARIASLQAADLVGFEPGLYLVFQLDAEGKLSSALFGAEP